ncbi:uncharacterized protein LOC134213674 isoform X3 [Armigeres subalbatus]
MFKTEQPIFKKAYQVPYKIKDKFLEHLDMLESQGVITHIRASEWASPVIAIPKKDGDIRMISVGNHVTTAHKNQLKMIYVPKQRSKVYVTMREAAKKRKRGSIEDEDEFTGFPDIPSVAEDAGHTNKKYAQTRSPIITRSKAALSTNYSASDS